MINRIKQAIRTFRNPQGETAGLTEKQKRRSLIARLVRRYKFRVKMEMEKLRQAIASAESPTYPLRDTLYAIYHNIELDDEVITQKRVATVTIQRAPFIIERNGKVDEDAKEIFDQQWFFEFLEKVVETEFWGHTLLEFSQLKKGEAFNRVIMIPREHVRPEYGDVVINQGDGGGVDFTNSKEFPYLFEIGKPTELGLYKVIAVPSIRKSYSETDWSIYSERYGMPMLHIKTSTRDKKEIDKLEDFGANFGSNGYIITSDSDDVQMESGNKVGGERVFQNRIELSQKQIAKLINGQSSTSDEKAYVGAAEVHERLLNDFTFSRLRRICYLVNNRLIPFMISHGLPLEGCRLIFPELEDQLQGEGTTNSPGEEKKKKKSKKKSKQLSFEKKLNDYYRPFQFRHLAFHPVTDNWIIKISKGSWKKDDYHDLFITKDIEAHRQAVLDAIDIDWHNLDTQHPMFNTLEKMRANIFSFSLAKLESFQKEIGNINVKSATQWNKKVRPIIDKYFNRWSETEYNLTLASTQQAERWQTIEEKKKLLPYLQYDAVHDSRTRDAHAALDGTTLPVDDEFWDSYYPPNGYNCRCGVMQVAGGEQKPDALPEIPDIFKNNAGKSGKIFQNKASYLSRSKQSPKEVQKQLNHHLKAKEIFNIISGKVKAHALATPSVAELSTAKKLGRKFIFDVEDSFLQGKPQPDGRIWMSNKWKSAEIKNPTSSQVRDAIRSAKRQADVIVIDYLGKSSKESIYAQIKGRVAFYKKLGKQLNILFLYKGAFVESFE